MGSRWGWGGVRRKEPTVMVCCVCVWGGGVRGVWRGGRVVSGGAAGSLK